MTNQDQLNTSLWYKNLDDKDLIDIFGDTVFQTQPRKHQLACLAFALDGRDRVVFWCDIGTGKTLIALYLSILWGCKSTLVVCPNSAIRTWEDEIKKHTNKKSEVLRGEKEKRQFRALNSNKDFCILNYEGLKAVYGARNPGDKEKGKKGKFEPTWSMINQAQWDCIIFDEMHNVRSPYIITTRLAFNLSRNVGNVVMMTGSPISKDELDLWSEYHVLNQGASLGRNYLNFRAQYFKQGWFDWTIKPGSRERILNRVAPVTIRYGIEECVDLPPDTRIVRYIEMSDEQKKTTQEIEEELRAEFEIGELTLSNAMTKSSKLAQITAGFLYVRDDEGQKQVHRFKQNPKMEALMDCLEEFEGKCLIFHEFVEEGRLIEEALDKAKIEYASLRGEIDAEQRDKNLTRFLDDKACRVLIAHPKCGGESLNLQCANVAIFYANSYSGAIVRRQEEGRIHRAGQEADRVVFIDLICSGSVDETILDIAQGKRVAAQAMLDRIAGKE